MTKPVAGITTFNSQTPPWQTAQLDANFAAVDASINDMGTYSNPLTDTSGAANTITVAIPAGLTASYVLGLLLYIKVANTTTSATVTVNLGALGAINVKMPSGANPTASTLIAGGVYPFFFDGTNFQVVGGVSDIQSGSFTATLGGFTGTVTGTVKYQIIGNMVTIYLPQMLGTSNSTTMTLTGVPAAIQPVNGKFVPLSPSALVNNGGTVASTADMFLGGGIGTWTFCLAGALPGIFVASGSKGIGTATNIMYTLD